MYQLLKSLVAERIDTLRAFMIILEINPLGVFLISRINKAAVLSCCSISNDRFKADYHQRKSIYTGAMLNGKMMMTKWMI